MSKTTNALVALGVVAGLGAAALPLSSYALTEYPGTGDPLTATGNVPVQLKIDETLSMFITDEAGTADFTSPVALSSTDKVNYESTPIAIQVNAGNKDGYHLTMHGSYTKEGQTGVETALVNENNTTIATGDLTSTTESQWGYKVLKGADGASLDATWNAVQPQATAAAIDSLDKAGVQTTKVTFGAHVIAGQEAGIYDGQVTFTATAGPEA